MYVFISVLLDLLEPKEEGLLEPKEEMCTSHGFLGTPV